LLAASQTGYSSIGIKEVEDPRRFGVVLKDKNGFIEKLIEKPETPISNLAIVGIYYIANSLLLKQCLNDLIDKDIKTRGEYQLTDALQMMLDKGEKFSTFSVDGWYDCGKPETLLETNRYLLDKAPAAITPKNSVIIPPVYIDESAEIECSVIGPYTTVAAGASVKDSIVRDTIISDGASVQSALLEESIIGNNASVRGNFNNMNVGNSSEINYK
jgi:glucose-1-phosphate thymidylyltransferase